MRVEAKGSSQLRSTLFSLGGDVERRHARHEQEGYELIASFGFTPTQWAFAYKDDELLVSGLKKHEIAVRYFSEVIANAGDPVFPALILNIKSGRGYFLTESAKSNDQWLERKNYSNQGVPFSFLNVSNNINKIMKPLLKARADYDIERYVHQGATAAQEFFSVVVPVDSSRSNEPEFVRTEWLTDVDGVLHKLGTLEKSFDVIDAYRCYEGVDLPISVLHSHQDPANHDSKFNQYPFLDELVAIMDQAISKEVYRDVHFPLNNTERPCRLEHDLKEYKGRYDDVLTKEQMFHQIKKSHGGESPVVALAEPLWDVLKSEWWQSPSSATRYLLRLSTGDATDPLQCIQNALDVIRYSPPHRELFKESLKLGVDDPQQRLAIDQWAQRLMSNMISVDEPLSETITSRPKQSTVAPQPVVEPSPQQDERPSFKR